MLSPLDKMLTINLQCYIQRSFMQKNVKITASLEDYLEAIFEIIEEKQGVKVIEKHRTLYEFLTQILDIEPNEASANACKIEHCISEDVLQRLIAFIKFNRENY